MVQLVLRSIANPISLSFLTPSQLERFVVVGTFARAYNYRDDLTSYVRGTGVVFDENDSGIKGLAPVITPFNVYHPKSLPSFPDNVLTSLINTTPEAHPPQAVFMHSHNSTGMIVDVDDILDTLCPYVSSYSSMAVFTEIKRMKRAHNVFSSMTGVHASDPSASSTETLTDANGLPLAGLPIIPPSELLCTGFLVQNVSPTKYFAFLSKGLSPPPPLCFFSTIISLCHFLSYPHEFTTIKHHWIPIKKQHLETP